MLDHLAAVRPPERIYDHPSPVDLREILALKKVQENSLLWFDTNGRLMGFALVDHYQNLCFELDWQILTPDLESEIISWGEKCLRQAMQTSGQVFTLDASCRTDDLERMAFFQRHGFVMQENYSVHMMRSLDEPIPGVQLPQGFHIRHIAGKQEVEALVALHRAAFGTENMTVEERLAMMHTPDYEAQLDLLAIAPDGLLVAYCMCFISQEENERSGRKVGYTDPVATHPDFQGRGLARALLVAGMQRLKERGIQTALLGTSSDNIPMQRAAMAVGFRVQSTTAWFARDVLPGA